ncbi:hypothetical protein [Frankia sp. AiPa1]|uniref:hypothetical protein n=1 Tax=Frankia sp. AiPa1 TaxID=573492 RepID=UPI00202B6A96|nr:hypothetical protein [Frankia sp. AiPa1]MCL9762026.1 hypothetical protein [Frankia sp. AiPa1]
MGARTYWREPAIDSTASSADRGVMGDVGKPERIVEDEPLSFPDAEPLTIPAVPATPAEPATQPELEPVPG